MTNKIKSLLKISSLVLVVFSMIFSQIQTNARYATTTDDRTANPIPADFTQSIPIYFFRYGSSTSDLDIREAIGKITIDGNGFELIPTAFEDWYNGDPNRADSDGNIPPQPVCNASYAGNKYRINPSLATTTSLTYGLQSARNKSAPSGTATAGILNIPGRTTNGLREKHTGCIKLEVRVKTGAVNGSISNIAFDQDFAVSPDYQEDRRPGLQVVKLAVGPAQAVSSSSIISSTPVSSVSSSIPPASSQATIPTSSKSSIVITKPVRSGGFTLIGGISLVILSIVGLVGFKMYRTKKIKKIDLS